VVAASDRCIWLESGSIRDEGLPGEVVERYRAAVGATAEEATVGGDEQAAAGRSAMADTLAAEPSDATPSP
jgi:hypothetical protein